MCTNNQQLTDQNTRATSTRLAIWDLEPKFHCSIIGTCLSIKELQRLGSKMKLSRKTLHDSYQLHSAFVALVNERSIEARLVNKLLNKKFRQSILRFNHAKQPLELSALWQEGLKSGEIAAAFWSLITHPNTPTELVFSALGKVHMLSHLSGETIRVDMLKLTKLQRVLPELEEQLISQEKKSQQALAKKDKLIQQLHKQISALQDSDRQLKLTSDRLQQLEQQIGSGALQQQNEHLSKQLQGTESRITRAEKETEEWKTLASVRVKDYDQLEVRMDQLISEQATVEQTLQNFLSPACMTGAADGAGNIDLCNRCILFVGGRNRQSAHFRNLVEKLNGRFLHHDGGVEESSQRLSALVAQSDAVLCPLDCVSHDAMNRIKRDCKHQGKSLQLLRQSGLATFTQGLQRIATEH
ncbi:MAG: DUF2325 domain-containing protein [Cycloclasticus sp.]